MKDALGKTITKGCKIAGLALSSWTTPWFYVGKISGMSKRTDSVYVKVAGEEFLVPAGECVVVKSARRVSKKIQ